MIEHAEILQAVEERRRAERERRKQQDAAPVEITSKFIRDCLYANEFGDGVLFAEIHTGKFIYDKTAGEWYRWTGHHWEIDIEEKSLAAVEGVVEKYLQEARDLVTKIADCHDDDAKRDMKKTQEFLYARIARLRSDRGRKNCLNFARTNNINALSITGDRFDINHWLLPCKNGVIDLRTGELKDGKPDDYMVKSSSFEYRGLNEPAPNWEKAVLEIMDNKELLVEFVAKLFGYGVTGHASENILPVFFGQGRNGKTTIVEGVGHALGDLAGPIQSEMLLDQGRAKNSSGPSPDIMALRGMRIVFASESDEGRRFSPSRVKWLSGSDTLVGRAPHDKRETRFQSSHLLFLLTNNKPHAPADDFAFWERVRLIPFMLSFVDRDPQAANERPADKKLMEKIKLEAPGILAWIVRGCIAWQRDGLIPPTIVKEATASYRREEDILADFIDECCIVDPDGEVNASDLYNKFTLWWEKNVNNKKIPSHKRFGTWMLKKPEFKKEKVGTYKYYGIMLADNLNFPSS